jgi:hypothetical protein
MTRYATPSLPRPRPASKDRNMLDDNCNGDNVIRWPPPSAIPRRPPPTVEVRRVRDRRGDLLVVPRCPFCAKRHTHGAANKPCGSLHHRLVHCVSPPPEAAGGYYLYEPCEPEPPPPAATKPKATTARPSRPRGKRALVDFRREGDPRIRAALFRRLCSATASLTRRSMW